MEPGSFSGVQWQNKGQWAQIGTDYVAYEHEEKLLYIEDNGVQGQAAQTSCGVTFSGNV